MNEPIFFSTQTQFREWLVNNHNKETELIVGYYKIKSGYPSMTWSQSVDQALCFGWIDGVRKSIDEHSYQIRFTPRRKESGLTLVHVSSSSLVLGRICTARLHADVRRGSRAMARQWVAWLVRKSRSSR